MPKKTATHRAKRIERYGPSDSPLYGLRNHARLAEVLFWVGSGEQLKRFSRRSENYIRYTDKTKPDKPRLIEAPEARLKGFQTRILELVRRIVLPDYLHSARPGRSYLSNSDVHIKVVGCTLTMDIDSFYQSVSLYRVADFFATILNCSGDIALTLARLLCCDGHLATGSPASPLVSFWACHEVFDSIDRRVRARGGEFTLYIDDMALTGKGIGDTDAEVVKRLLHGAGLRVKASKTKVFRADRPKLITGRAGRNGVSRAPNKQHKKMREAQALLDANPNDATLRASVAGRKRHLALLDEKNAARHRIEAAMVAKGK